MSWKVFHGTVENILRELPENSFDAVLCDPPYGLSFMGKAWDYKVPKASMWAQVLRVMKPGAPLLAFSSTRTYHRTAVEVEDGGFEIVDMISWLYGSGFPKSHDVSKALDKRAGETREIVNRLPDRRGDGTNYGLGHSGAMVSPEPKSALGKVWSGYGTALKPACEPAVLAVKPHDGTIAQNIEKWGVGGINIDASRIGTEARYSPPAGNTGATPASFAPVNVSGYVGQMVKGRWPANVVLTHSPDCELVGTKKVKAAPQWKCATGCPVALLDQQSGITKTAKRAPRMQGSMGYHGGAKGALAPGFEGDEGGASRFFYCPKPSRAERGTTNKHPTLKPTKLTEYFARMLKPPGGGRILIPFAGSGSEMVGAYRAGWADIVGIEWWAPYVKELRRRMTEEEGTGQG